MKCMFLLHQLNSDFHRTSIIPRTKDPFYGKYRIRGSLSLVRYFDERNGNGNLTRGLINFENSDKCFDRLR